MAKKLPKDRKTNPNGANQYLLDPRQKLCWDNYVNPKSETFANATQSAIKAGYDEDYAEHVTTSEWFSVKLRRLNMLDKAEKVLNETLEMADEVQIIVDGVPLDIRKREPALTKIKQDTAKFVAERLGKAEGYSTRNELTGADGKDLIPVDLEAKEKADAAISSYLGKK